MTPKHLKEPHDHTAPAWARFKCRDNDGTWTWFECKPHWNKKLGNWSAIRGESLCLGVVESHDTEGVSMHDLGHNPNAPGARNLMVFSKSVDNV